MKENVGQARLVATVRTRAGSSGKDNCTRTGLLAAKQEAMKRWNDLVVSWVSLWIGRAVNGLCGNI